MGCKFGDAKGMPLLVAVRSGARDSMPGMMDTILNLGLNDETVLSLVAATKNERFAWDCYRRFIQMYGDVVLGVQKREGEDHEPVEVVIEEIKHKIRQSLIVGVSQIGTVHPDTIWSRLLEELYYRHKCLTDKINTDPPTWVSRFEFSNNIM
jgi:hypothetical protein